MELTVFHRFGIALALGLLVGFQREWAAKRVAGIRTFSLIAVFGFLCTEVASELGPWMPLIGLGGVVAFLLMANMLRPADAKPAAGITTEVAAMVMFVVGMLVGERQIALAIVVTGTTAVLLHWKQPLHELTKKVGEKDLQAVFRMVLVGLVILPALPDASYGPYDVINPFRIWLMVVLIVGISLAAYVAFKLFGERTGTLLAGILGGLISSTATTVSASRHAATQAGAVPMSAIVIMIASTIVFLRVLVEIAIVAPHMLVETAPPLAAVMALMAAVSAGFFWFVAKSSPTVVPMEPPGLKSAIAFGLVYMLVLLGVAAAKDHFGHSGLYVAAALSGLTDMDAITLSTAELVNQGKLEASVAWRAILVGAMANLVFKGGVAAVLGGRALFYRIFAGFGITLAGGIAVLLLWP